jgi:amino acid adenylation domain-containing protein
MLRLHPEDEKAGTLSEPKRALVERYLRGEMTFRSAGQAIPLRSPDEPIPLSYEQEQVWLHAQMAPDLPLYNEPVTIHQTGPLDVAVLERSFNEILRRHEAWRTCFTVVDGQPRQVVQPNLTISLPVADLRGLPREEREAEAVRLATEDARASLDLARVPLFRARVVRLDDEEHRLYLTLSHIISDGVALYRVFLPELAALYKAFAAGNSSPLPELAVQYPDYACWQRRCARRETLTEDIAYWRERLGGEIPALYLPADRVRTGPRTFRGSMYPFSLSGSVTRALRLFSQAEGMSTFHVLFASFAALLHRYSGEAVIPVGSVTAVRDHPETQSLLGYFLRTVVLVAHLSGDPSFRELAKRARNTALEALEHDNLPFEHVVHELGTRRDPGHNPLFQAMFSLEPPLPELDASWRLTHTDVDTGATKYDLYLELDERSDEILARFHYSTELFDPATVVRMAAHWKALLEGALADPGQCLSELPLLSPAERRQLLAEWNDTGRPYPQACIHELFEAQVERSPDAVAVVCGDSRLTYRELNERANRLAWRLRKLGVGPEVLVGLCVERSLEMVVGLLAILKAGGAYVPLDPALPQERLAFMLSDAKPRVLLIQQRLQPNMPWAGNVVPLDADWEGMAEESRDNPGECSAPGNLAYVIYTSGSTGQPKGVQVEHRSVVNLLCSMQRDPGLSGGDVLVAVTTLSFDIAGLEIYLPLITGARLVVATSPVAGDGTLLLALLRQSAATVMQATPATWRLLLEAGWEGSGDLKVLCGGEALPPALSAELTRRSRSVWNLYGPTETTIWSSVCRVDGRETGTVPIGRPIANTQIYILDPHLNPVPTGVWGEIYIGGHGVARGYLNQPATTAERFIPDPFGERAGAGLYKSGDLARYLVDGNIEYLGRLDYQVKIRGFRIELGEIEAVLRRHPAVRDAVVLARGEEGGDKRLIAYLLPAQEPAATIGDVRGFLSERLPSYMVPAHLVMLDTLPLTPNGKIDRRKMPAPEDASREQDGAYLEPKSPLEAQLAQIWEELLGVRPVGTRDNFFDLGGDSLLAVRMLHAIEREVGRRLPLSTLFAGATIEHLAQALLQQQAETFLPPVTAIHPAGSRPPFFFLHGDYNGGFYCLNLARALGPEQPFHALHPHGLGGRPGRPSIEAMAADHLTTLQSLQSQGPYRLGGYCNGGLIAFEIARRLKAQGQRVDLLVLVDSRVYNTGAGARILRALVERLGQIEGLTPQERLKCFVSLQGRIRGLNERAKRYLRRLCALDGTPKQRLIRIYSTFRRLLRRLVPESPRERIGAPLSFVVTGLAESPAESLEEVYQRAVAGYLPRRYAGKIIVFRSHDAALGEQPDLGWGAVAREVDVHPIAGDHFTSITRHVRSLGERLQDVLRSRDLAT